MKLNSNVLFLPVAGLFFGGCNLSGQQVKNQPNIVLIVADDLGYNDLGIYGCKNIKTPNLDRLAKEGVRFTQFYANGPECTPTRAALLTGKYQQRVGGLECALGSGNVGRYDEAEWLAGQQDLGLPSDYSIIPSSLKQAGYSTAIIGKWHLGYEKKFRPGQHGFDYSFGPIGFGGDYFYHVEKVSINQPDFTDNHTLAENGIEVFRDGQYMTELITTQAVKWINDQSRHKPFFLYLPYTAPHDPYQGPGDDLGRPLTEEEWNFKSRDKYIEMVEALDKGLGEIFDTLEKNGHSNETVVIFFSDNGGTSIADNGVLSGFKGQLLEGGIRVPCIIRWPEKIDKGIVSDQVALSFDLTHSVLALAGLQEAQIESDGIDIINMIINREAPTERNVFWRAKRGNRIRKAVRSGDMKMIVESTSGGDQAIRLFDLKNDIGEKNDLSASSPEKLEAMKVLLSDWEAEVHAPRLQGFPEKN